MPGIRVNSLWVQIDAGHFFAISGNILNFYDQSIIKSEVFMSISRIFMALSAGAMLLMGSACNPVVDTKAEGAKVNQLNDDWIAAVHAKDVGKIEALFADKSISMDRGKPLFTNPSEIRASFEKSLQDPLFCSTFKGSSDTVEVSASGDLAWNSGPFSFTYTTPSGPEEFIGKWITLWKKIDGQWKIIMDYGTDTQIRTLPNSSAALVEEFTKLEEQWNDATFNKDAKALDLLLAKEYSYSDDMVDWTTKQQAIDEITSGNYKYESKATVSDVSVNLYDNVAIVKGKNTFKATYKGKNISGTFKFVDIFVWRDGRWQCVTTK